MAPKTISSKSELADWLGVSRKTVYEWMKLPDFPVEPNGDISPFKVGRWCERREITALFDEDGDDESGDLTALKCRKLHEEIRAKRRENDKAEGSLLPVEVLSETHDIFANTLRGGIENLQRNYGNDAAELMTESLDEGVERVRAYLNPPAENDSE